MQCGHMQKHMEAEVYKGKLTQTHLRTKIHTHLQMDTHKSEFLCAGTNTCTYCACKQAQRYKGTHKGIA